MRGWIRTGLNRCRGDRGSGALEYALIAPVFLAITFLVIQAGLYWAAQNVMNSVADETGRAVRSFQSYGDGYLTQMPSVGQMQGVGQQAVGTAESSVDGGDLANNVALGNLTADPTTRTITVEVTGRPISLLGFDLPLITSKASGTYEGWDQNAVDTP